MSEIVVEKVRSDLFESAIKSVTKSAIAMVFDGKWGFDQGDEKLKKDENEGVWWPFYVIGGL